MHIVAVVVVVEHHGDVGQHAEMVDQRVVMEDRRVVMVDRRVVMVYRRVVMVDRRVVMAANVRYLKIFHKVILKHIDYLDPKGCRSF